jgi:pimeloyl-ACP methyl ester carboxylesterase
LTSNFPSAGAGFVLRILFFLGSSVLISGCAAGQGAASQFARQDTTWERTVVRVDTFRVVDPAQHRAIPLATYTPAARPTPAPRLKVALLNHGYGGTNTAYSFLAKNLVAHGYYVLSLQQDLPGDAPLPTTGDPAVVRRPAWERGVQNMLFVLQELRRTPAAFDLDQVLLVGHSNGGDMVMLFAQEHPELVERVISLDNRRVPLPRASRPRVLSLRSSDQPADAGVLPTPAEQAAFGLTIVPLPATLHNDMWDGATRAQKREMNDVISKFLAQ